MYYVIHKSKVYGKQTTESCPVVSEQQELGVRIGRPTQQKSRKTKQKPTRERKIETQVIFSKRTKAGLKEQKMTKQKRQTNESIMEAWEGKTMDPPLHSRTWDIPESIASSHMADLYQTGSQVNTNLSTLKSHCLCLLHPLPSMLSKAPCFILSLRPKFIEYHHLLQSYSLAN